MPGSEALVTMCSHHNHNLSDALKALLEDRCRIDEPLSRRTSLRIGGPASWWTEPHTLKEVQQIVELAARHERSVHLVGLGSNALFPDEGIDGVVMRLSGELSTWQVCEDRDDAVLIEVGAGCVNAHLVKALLKQGFVGAEFLMLIPGLFGGGVVMNAGTRDAELGGILERVTYIDSADGMIHTVSADTLHMTYRHATLPRGAIVVSGVIRVMRGDVGLARERAQQDKDRRNVTQPYRLASVGSTFANPEGDYAGRLIEASGLKGVCCGGAQISELHANFFINAEGATARDFLTLMARARVEVRRRFDVELRPEVRFVGFDGWALLSELEAVCENESDTPQEVVHVG